MVRGNDVIVLDIDGTICEEKGSKNYDELKPIDEALKKVREYREKGFYIILFTSRQMRTYEGNVGQITKNTGRVLFDWLEKYDIPYDELHFGKPWCGNNGFYVDDKAIRPDEFINLSFEEISKLISKDVQEK